MLMVVYGHVLAFVLDCKIRESVMGAFLVTFHIPLFFFISGILAHKTSRVFDANTTLRQLWQKFAYILVPTLIFMTAYHLIMNGNVNGIINAGPGRYWFTYTLFLYFATYYAIAAICHVLKCQHAEVITLLLALFVGIFYIVVHPHETILHRWLQTENYANWMQFFALGLVCHRYQNKTIRILNNNLLRTTAIVLFILVFSLHFHNILPPFVESFSSFILLRYFGLAMVFIFFYHYRNYFNNDSIISNSLKFIGQRTLDIYLLHYFFFCDLSILKPFFEGNAHPLIEWIFGLSMAFIIIGSSLLLSSLIRTSDTLARHLLAAR